ncbi:MAG TPA: PD-(D/E)XK nuclease family protein [bacterium]|nr:PD-(D/E)XK nuclease family protein [bacterium]
MTEHATQEPVAEADGRPVNAAALGEAGQYAGPAVVKLSHTTIATALACPRKWKYRYVDQLEPVAQPAAFAFGRAVHAAVAQAYACQNAPMTAEEVAGVFAQHFAALDREGISYKEKEKYEDLLAKGRALAALWYEKHRDDVLNAKVLACEAYLSHNVDVGLVLQGYADIVEERDGRLLVGDHKTVASWGDSDEVAMSQSTQFLGYAYLVWKKYERIPEGAYVTVLKKTKTPDAFRYYMQPPSLDQLCEFEVYVRDVASVIRFYQTEQIDVKNVSRNCSWCPYAGLCFNVEGAEAMFKPRKHRTAPAPEPEEVEV